MLSKNSFLIGFVLSVGAMTLHDLRRTVVFQGLSNEQRDKMLFEGLAQLCRNKLLIWSFEPDYGNTPPIKPPDCGEETFLKFWRDFISKSDLSVETPDSRNRTLFVEATPELNAEIDKSCYDAWRQKIQW